MSYYVKGFGTVPLKLKVTRTSNPEISDGKTKLEAISRTIVYCSRVLNEWKKDSSIHGKTIVKQQKLALKLLGKLLIRESK